MKEIEYTAAPSELPTIKTLILLIGYAFTKEASILYHRGIETI